MVTRAIRGLPNVPALDDKALTDFLEDTRKVILQLRSEQIAGGSGSGAGSGGSGGSTGSGGSGGSTTPPYEPDLTPPPTPTGVVVSAGLDFVFMTTDAPIFSQGHGYGRTIVYGAKYSGSGPLPTFLDAVVVHEFVGQVGSFPTEPSTQWHIWLKWRSADGIESTTPAGGANGYTATTGVDISNLLIALTGAITTSELHSALSSRIDLIDGNGIGSVNERINTGDTALQTQITTLVASVAGNSAAIATEQSVRATADGFISAYYGLRTQVSQGGRTVVGGIGIMGTSGGTAGPTIDVGVVANKFYVTAPSGTTGVGDVVPFVIQTADEVVNGVSIPRGVYMDAAFIKNVQAITAKLGTLWVTNAMMVNVSADKLTTGSIAVGREIRSSDFVTGVSGWRLGGNHAEIGSSYIRGLLTAAQIDTTGLQIQSNGTVAFASGGSLDWTRIIGTGKPAVYRAIAFGLGAVGSPGAGVYNAETNALLHAPGRSYNLLTIARSTGARTFQTFDVYGNGAGGGTAATLAAALNALTSAQAFCLLSYDEPWNLRMTGGLPVAIYRNGGSPGKFESPLFKSRGAYMLIAYGGCGPGNALFEGYAGGSTDTGGTGPDDAWIDTTFSLVNGNVVMGGNALQGFRLDANNASTYIDNAAIKSAMIETLVADRVTGGSFAGRTFTGGTFTGSVFQTSDPALNTQRVTLNEANSNEARFYGNRGDGTTALLASIGITSAGADNAVVKIGTSVSPYYGVHATSTIDAVVGHTYATSPTRAAVVGWSRATGGSAFAAGVVGQADGAGYGVYGMAASGAGVNGASTSGAGVFGISGSAAGVHGQSSTGYGGEFLGNATRSPVRLQTLYNSPPAAEDGAIAVLNTPQGYALCWAQGGSWKRMSGTVVAWNS